MRRLQSINFIAHVDEIAVGKRSELGPPFELKFASIDQIKIVTANIRSYSLQVKIDFSKINLGLPKFTIVS